MKSIDNKNLHLITSAIIIIPVAVAYGIAPDFQLPSFFDFIVSTPDLKNIFRVIMCLYLSQAALWVMAVFRSFWWITATLSNFLFMLGLAAGRLLSWIIDGEISLKFLLGMTAELLLAAWAIYNLKRYQIISKNKC